MAADLAMGGLPRDTIAPQDTATANRWDYNVVFMTKGLFYSELDRFGCVVMLPWRQRAGSHDVLGVAERRRCRC